MEKRGVIIIGAGPAGLSAAIFTQPDGWSTLVLEANWVGGQGAIAYTVNSYPGFPPGEGTVLMNYMEKQVTLPPPAGVGAELRQERVLSLDTKDLVVTTEANQYQAKAIILATGSTMQKLGVPGEDKFVGKSVLYYAKRDYKQFSGKKALKEIRGSNKVEAAVVLNNKTAEQKEIAIDWVSICVGTEPNTKLA